MGTKRRVYSEEFKSEAIEMADKIGISQAGKELGINPNNINRWKSSSSPKSAKHQKSLAELEKECRQLQKENGYLRKINEVLKKSTAIFSSDQI